MWPSAAFLFNMEMSSTKSRAYWQFRPKRSIVCGIYIIGYILGFLSFMTMGFFSPFVFHLLAMWNPSLPSSELIIIPICSNPWKKGSRVLIIWQWRFDQFLSTEFHLIDKTVFSVPLRRALGCKILHKIVSLVCQLPSLSLLHFSEKAIDTEVLSPISTSLCPAGKHCAKPWARLLCSSHRAWCGLACTALLREMGGEFSAFVSPTSPILHDVGWNTQEYLCLLHVKH